MKISTANTINEIMSKGISHASNSYSREIEKGTINKVYVHVTSIVTTQM